MLHDRPFAELDPATLYRILQLRSQVFVVEQACVFLEPDGVDLDPSCRLLWIADEAGEVVAAARIIDGGDARRLGRIVTAERARGRGHAGRLIEHALATTDPPWVLHGQSHLADWYRTFGFEVSGDEYLDDGIPHVPMRRDA